MLVLSDFMMTTRKGGTNNYKSNHKTNVDKYIPRL